MGNHSYAARVHVVLQRVIRVEVFPWYVYAPQLAYTTTKTPRHVRELCCTTSHTRHFNVLQKKRTGQLDVECMRPQCSATHLSGDTRFVLYCDGMCVAFSWIRSNSPADRFVVSPRSTFWPLTICRSYAILWRIRRLRYFIPRREAHRAIQDPVSPLRLSRHTRRNLCYYLASGFACARSHAHEGRAHCCAREGTK